MRRASVKLPLLLLIMVAYVSFFAPSITEARCKPHKHSIHAKQPKHAKHHVPAPSPAPLSPQLAPAPAPLSPPLAPVPEETPSPPQQETPELAPSPAPSGSQFTYDWAPGPLFEELAKLGCGHTCYTSYCEWPCNHCCENNNTCCLDPTIADLVERGQPLPLKPPATYTCGGWCETSDDCGYECSSCCTNSTCCRETYEPYYPPPEQALLGPPQIQP